MYSYIIGVVTAKESGKICLENNGIGYEIFVSSQTLEILPQETPVKIFTYLNVREDEMSLYGFASIEEKNMFMLLTTVSGIGPKMALGILSEISITGLISAIYSQDIKTLCKIKGLGKKTAERVLLELKDKVNPFDALLSSANDGGKAVEVNDQVDEAIQALMGLGVNKNEAYRLVTSVAKKDMSIEEIITNALRSMGR